MALPHRLPPTGRRMRMLPILVLIPLVLTPALLGASSVQAALLKSSSMTVLSNGDGSRDAGDSLRDAGGPLEDTCTASDELGLCDLDDFIARCDAAGGGLSTLPGGGVDCDTSSWDN